MRKLYFFLIALSGVTLYSCNPSYVPSAPHTPIFSNQGELQLRLNGGTSGLDPQIAYAATEHVGFMANASFNKETDPTTGEVNSHKYYELGTGYYNNFDGRFVFEVFGGYGMGQIEGDFSSTSSNQYSSPGNMRKFFLQPAFGMVTDVFDFSIASRFSGVELIPEIPSDKINSTVFFEPCLSAGVGFKYLKFHMQLGLSMPLTDETQLSFTYQPFIWNTSIVARLWRKYY